MSSQTKQMWAALLRAGVVEGAVPERVKLESPWYVKVLLAFSGWLGGLFLLGFVGMSFLFVLESNTAAFITGCIMLGVAFTILRLHKNEFIEHLGLAISMAGQILIVYCIFETTYSYEVNTWLLLVVLLQVPLALIMPNFVHRVFSSFAAAIAFSIALTYGGWPDIASGTLMILIAGCWLNEFRYPQHMRKIQAIGYGLVLALIYFKGTTLYGYRTIDWLLGHHLHQIWSKPWMSEVLTGAVALYIVWHLLQRYGKPLSEPVSIVALLGTFILCALSIEAHGITTGIVLMLLGFSGSNRILLGLGIVSLLFHISSYYYLLDTTLLAKSLTLFIVGVALLVFRWLMLRTLPLRQEVNHA